MMLKTLGFRHQRFSRRSSNNFASSVFSKKSNIVLMGPPGSGKSSVARVLSRSLGKKMIDIDDDWLEPLWGTSVASKLKELGDAAFLEAEGQALLQFHEKDSIVSLSGSNPLHPQAMKHIAKDGVVVYLDTPFKTILDRMHRMKVDRIVGQNTTTLEKILAYRYEIYENSYDLRVIVTEGESEQAIAQKVLKQLKRNQAYLSTRGWKGSNFGNDLTFLDVVRKGLAPDRGLFMPREYVPFTPAQLQRLVPLSYQERAQRVMERFPLGTLHPSVLRDCIQRAYQTFDDASVLPVTHLYDDTYLMEMDHGPTASFKDLSLQLAPKIMSHALQQANEANASHIPVRTALLVATSGDTGTAALDGFGREKGIPVVVLYPENGVSNVQKAQMVTAPPNVCVIGVESDFDFCQTTIKDILENQALSSQFEKLLPGLQLTSANSMNFGRFLPQVVFVVSSYCELVKSGKIKFGDEIDVTVPTGNFGNILGAFFAKRLGIPIHNLICASNSNNILSDFISTGRYDMTNRSFLQTISPAIDILVSSNLERFLYILLLEEGQTEAAAGQIIERLYSQLKNEKFFTIPPALHAKVTEELKAGWCSESQCLETMVAVMKQTGRMIDPHTAVAKFVAKQWATNARPMLIASTANFGKFPEATMMSVGQRPEGDLATLFQNPLFDTVPSSLRALVSKPINHKTTLPADQGLIVEHIKQYFSNYKP